MMMADQVMSAVNGLDRLQVNGVLEWGGMAHHRALCEPTTGQLTFDVTDGLTC